MVEHKKFEDGGLDTMTTQINAEKAQAGGFVAGTLVHTQEGLRPIEEIKVGDYVLSKPENGEGELAYKRVTRTYEFDDKEVWYISFHVMENRRKGMPDLDGDLFVTGDHPFWVESFDGYAEWGLEAQLENAHLIKSWIKADRLQDGMLLLLTDGRLVKVGFVYKLIRMQISNLAWFTIDRKHETLEGFVVNFNEICPKLAKDLIKDVDGNTLLEPDYSHNYDESDNTNYYFNQGIDWQDYSHNEWFKRKVYNLEVDDFHTYFVAKQGVWVHAH